MNKQHKKYIVQLITRQARSIRKEGHSYTLAYSEHLALITGD